MRRSGTALTIATLLAIVPTAAAAQEESPEGSPGTEGATTQPTFEFRMDELEITGQVELFDDFESGTMNPLLQDVGDSVTSVIDGALVFTDVDGHRVDEAQASSSDPDVTIPVQHSDRVDLDAVFTEGAGDFELTATLAAPIPSDGNANFLIRTSPADDPEAEWLIGVAWGDIGFPGPCGTSELWTYIAAGGLACDIIDPATLGDDLKMRLVHDDAAGTLEYLYSIDGGETYKSMTGFTVPGEPAGDFPPPAGATVSFEGQTFILDESMDG
jgi:hypothetical protein